MTLIHVDLIRITPRNRWRTKRTRPQVWRWTAKNGDNNKILARSSERYTNKQDCIDAINELFGPTANVYLRQKEHSNIMLRLANQFVSAAADSAGDDDPDNVA